MTKFGDTANNFYDYDSTMVDANTPAGVQLIVLDDGSDPTTAGRKRSAAWWRCTSPP